MKILMLEFIFLILFIIGTKGSWYENCTGYDCLKEYVDKPDPNYAWHDTGIRIDGFDPLHIKRWTGYVLNFTSQQWLTPEDSSQSLWWHLLIIVIPKEIQYPDTPFMWITGGNNDNDDIPKPLDTDLLVTGDVAVQTKTIGAALFKVPNQPIEFPGDPLNKRRKEDGIIAYTWWHYLLDPDANPEWLLRLPMTKASVRAMDTITAFMTSETAPQEIKDIGSNPSQFIIAGASKRGWTTWTTSAVDPRVIGAMPVVLDELNFVENLHHHYRAYGGWSFALQDYWEMNMTLYLDDPKFQELLDIVEMYNFRDKLLMPKLVVNAANDEFFLPDDTRYWWREMPYYNDLNRFLLAPNAEHSETTGILELLPAATTWIRAILKTDLTQSKERYGSDKTKYAAKTIEERNSKSLKLMDGSAIPRFNWTIDSESGDITVYSETKPTSVHMWHSTTCNDIRRDYRIVNLDDPCTCGIKVGEDDLCANLRVLWYPEELIETSPGSLTWIAHQDPPSDGRWTAFFVDLQFDGPKPNSSPSFRPLKDVQGWPIGHDGTYEFTTEVSIVPDTFPYEDCYAESCYSHLL